MCGAFVVSGERSTVMCDLDSFGVDDVVKAADKCCSNCSAEAITQWQTNPTPHRWVESLNTELKDD